MRVRNALRRVRLGAEMYHAEARRARRGQSPPTPRCGRGLSELHCDDVPAFARYKSILRMYLVGMESIGRFMPTNLSICAKMSAQWYCATFRGSALSLERQEGPPWWSRSGGVAIGTFVTGGRVRSHEPFTDRQIGLWPEGPVPVKITRCSVLAAYWM